MIRSSIDRRDVASNSPVTFDLDFSQVTALSQSTSGIQASSQDGFAAGTLSSFSITESGRIKGVYSNGVTRDLGPDVDGPFLQCRRLATNWRQPVGRRRQLG